MKTIKLYHPLILIAVLLCSVAISCDKTEDIDGDSINKGTIVDVDGNVYHIVKIGTQEWTVENLKTTKYTDGTPIPNVTGYTAWLNQTTGAYCNYNNSDSNAVTYGRLYNWYAVNTGMLAPVGWHVPTDNDWAILEDYLIANGYNFDGSKEEDKIAKSLSAKTSWELSKKDGTPGAAPENNNSTGFTALAAGYRYSGGGFYFIGEVGCWWSSTELGETYAYAWGLGFGNYNLGRYGTNNKEDGYSVRLVKD